MPHWVGVAADAGRQLAVTPGACAEACARVQQGWHEQGPGIDLLNDRAIKQAKQLPVMRSPNTKPRQCRVQHRNAARRSVTTAAQRTCPALAIAQVALWVDAPPHKQGANVLAAHLHWLAPIQEDNLHTQAGAGRFGMVQGLPGEAQKTRRMGAAGKSACPISHPARPAAARVPP